MTPGDQKHQKKKETQEEFDLRMMDLALKLAQKSETMGEVPIGAVLVDENRKILAKSTNLRETKHTVLGHAELVALHRACAKRKSWRLLGSTLYVTLEPCFMCAGALVQARVSRVVYGTRDPKAGALGSLADLSKDTRLNHQFAITEGVLNQECSHILKNFFRQKRKNKKV